MTSGRCLIDATSALGSTLLGNIKASRSAGGETSWKIYQWNLPIHEVTLKCGKFIEIDLPDNFLNAY